MPALETERLLLRPFAEDDLDQLTAIMADPEVVKYLGHGPQDRHEVWRFIALALGHERLRGLELECSGQPRPRIGQCPRSHRLSDTVPRF